MVSPRTFHGYKNVNGTEQEVASCAAKDATEYLDPNEVKSAIDNLINVFQEEMNNIANALRDTTKDTNEAIIVQGTKMTGTVEDTADSIAKIPSQVVESFQQLYTTAVQTRDAIQDELNEAAYASVYNCGVDRITG